MKDWLYFNPILQCFMAALAVRSASSILTDLTLVALWTLLACTPSLQQPWGGGGGTDGLYLLFIGLLCCGLYQMNTGGVPTWEKGTVSG